MATIDFDKLKAAAHQQIESLVSSWIDGKVVGQEYVMINPTRPDEKPGSFKINLQTGVWCDFATNDGGNDLISFYRYIKNLPGQYDAAKELSKIIGLDTPASSTPEPAKNKKPADEKWNVISPIPDNAGPPYSKHWKLGKPSKRWIYKNETGQIIGYMYRFDPEKGGKEIWPLTYCVGETFGKKMYKWKSWSVPRPLYGLDLLHENTSNNVLIVEGEKTAEAAKKLLLNLMTVIAWPGGGKAVDKIDWKPLHGRKIIIWPDNDYAGMKTAVNICKKLKKIASGTRIINPPEKAPKAWDLADGLEKGWNQEMTVKYLKENLLDMDVEKDFNKVTAYLEKHKVKKKDSGKVLGQEEHFLTNEAARTFDRDQYPFKVLGYEGNNFYYLPDGGQQVICIRGNEHDEQHIAAYLAPLDLWENLWTATKTINVDGQWIEKNAGVDWKAVKRFLIWEVQYKKGVFAGYENFRATGIWYDNKRYIIHLGDRLIVDGIDTEISKIASNYIYEKKKTVEPNTYTPLTEKESLRLLEINKQFQWTRDISPQLLTGWIVAGLIGGALPWRPHLWINGPQGCGKSTVVNEVVHAVLGGCVAMFIEGSTSEAGLRQNGNHCSFPILYDEAESNGKKGQVRMEQIIELMRSSASPGKGKLLKGTSGGAALSFDVPACFCLVSISNNSKLAADIARIVNLEMCAADTDAPWEEFHKKIIDTINPEWAGRFRARIFGMLPVIRQNIDVFIRAVRDVLQSQRHGDVLGVVLGCSYSACYDAPVSFERAIEWVKGKDWTDEKSQKYDSDEIKCLSLIMKRIVTVKGDVMEDKTLWELMKELYNYYSGEGGGGMETTAEQLSAFGVDEAVTVKKRKMDEYDAAARRYGAIYRMEEDKAFIVIPNANPYILKWLKDEPYAPNWYKYLKRIKETINDVVYQAEVLTPRQFVKGERSVRSVKIPFEVCKMYLEEDE